MTEQTPLVVTTRLWVEEGVEPLPLKQQLKDVSTLMYVIFDCMDR